jgi:SAM-dependent methyltransferase
VSSEALPIADAAFDLVYSVAALEHVPHPRGTLEEVFRVLRPGGLAVHEIDLKHHGSADPLKFLEWNEAEWRDRARHYGPDLALDAILQETYTGEVFCNRLRQSDWLTLFSRAGFTVESAETLIVLDESRVKPERFTAEFRARPREDLRSLTVRIAARKPLDPDATISR